MTSSTRRKIAVPALASAITALVFIGLTIANVNVPDASVASAAVLAIATAILDVVIPENMQA